MARARFVLVHDEDITHLVSPNLTLVNDVLMTRVKPAVHTLGDFLRQRYPILAWIAFRAIRGRWEKVQRKYLSGLRSKEVFERYKVYRLVVLRKNG